MSKVSDRTLERLPEYLLTLEGLATEGVEYVSSVMIAERLGYKEILVKKDINCIASEPGKPKIGHNVLHLIHDIKDFLGYNTYDAACLVGAGKLGEALLCFSGFKEQNLEIVAAFDVNEKLVGTKVNNIPIYHVKDIEKICKEKQIRIGIITTPVCVAQDMCDSLIDGGIKGIWNFAPTVLQTKKDIIVRNENLAISLAYLSLKLKEKI